MLKTLDGDTQVYAILGDPIAQVKSPGGITQAMVRRGANAVLVPMHVKPPEFDGVMRALGKVVNIAGLIMTVPHKIPVMAHLETMTERARFLGACNVLRRIPGTGQWHGDATDGYGFVTALRNGGFDPKAKRALLVGAGGAGSAIALTLIEAGVATLAIHDADTARRDGLIARLNGLGKGRVSIGSRDPAGCDLAINATPTGMKPADPLPIDATRLEPGAVAADVITAPVQTPFLQAAAARGCATQTGVDMFQAQVEFIAQFMLGPGR
jgi:shikimate dehydrogenase